MAKQTATIESTDIVELILKDHKPLKALIKIMKDDEKDLSERRLAFEEFGPLLLSHAMPEERVLYVDMKSNEDMRVDGLEGDTEHALAGQMIEEAKRAEDDDVFEAKIKVLAELVEHHIKEEEEDMLPEFKKQTSAEERQELGALYLEEQFTYQDEELEVDIAEPGQKVGEERELRA